MDIEQNLSKENFHKLEPILPEKFKKIGAEIGKRILPYAMSYLIIFTPLVTGITLSQLQSGKSKEQIERAFSPCPSYIPQFIKEPLITLTYPGKSLAYYFYDGKFGASTKSNHARLE